MTFIERSKAEYEKIIKEKLENIGDKKFYVFGTECPAKIINTIKKENCLGFTASEPDEIKIDEKPVLPISSQEVQSAEAIVLSSLSNQEGQQKYLETIGYNGLIISVGNYQHLSTCMTFDPCPKDFFKQIKNTHTKEPALIIGNGPSLNNYNTNKLKGDLVTFGCNGIFSINNSIKLDYYFALDDTACKIWHEGISKCQAKKFFPANLKYKKWTKTINSEIIFYPSCYRKKESSDYLDLESFGVETSYTVALSMLQIAIAMGCDPINIIGVDLDFSKDKKYATKNYGRENIINTDFASKFSIETKQGLSRALYEARNSGVNIILNPSKEHICH